MSDRAQQPASGAGDQGWAAPGSSPQTPQPAAQPQAPQQPGFPPPPPGFRPAPGAQGGGWAPPPKPGLLPLRPLSFGTLLWAPFRTLRRNPAPTFGSGLLVQLASALLGAAVAVPVFIFVFSRLEQSAPGEQDAILSGSVALLLLTLLVPLVVGVVAGAFLQGVMVIEVATGTIGERLAFGALWRRAAKRIWPLIGWTAIVAGATVLLIALAAAVIVAAFMLGDPVAVIVTVLLVLGGALGVAVLAAWLTTKLALVPSAIMLEGAGLGQAMRRSWQLTDGFFWRTFGTLLLVAVILSFAAQVVVQPLSFLGGILSFVIDPTGTGAALTVTLVITGVTMLLSIVIGAITAVVQAALVAVIYIDLRMRKEGLDLTLQRTVEAREAGRPTVDPYAPAGAPAQPGAPIV